jgi:hypothetical protein
MQIIIDAYKKTKHLHHAYLIEGERQAIFLKLSRFLKDELGITAGSCNPDFWYGEFEKFGINEGRQIKSLQCKRSVTGLPRIFIIATYFFTKEAQNTLLKVFEEPAGNVHFFLITPSAENILPTLKSRLFIASDYSISSLSKESTIQACAFLGGGVAERVKMIRPLIDDKDKQKTIVFLNALETTLHNAVHDKEIQKYSDVFGDLMRCRSYLYGNAPSVKVILEHLAIAVPRL